jgi:hypothetical protein
MANPGNASRQIALLSSEAHHCHPERITVILSAAKDLGFRPIAACTANGRAERPMGPANPQD